jgi:hypothetical protein
MSKKPAAGVPRPPAQVFKFKIPLDAEVEIAGFGGSPPSKEDAVEVLTRIAASTGAQLVLVPSPSREFYQVTVRGSGNALTFRLGAKEVIDAYGL